MGIKGLNAFLRKKCPAAFVELPYSYFNGKRIAIDSDNILMKLMSRAHKEVVGITDVASEEPDREAIMKRCIYHIKNMIQAWLKAGATLIFVFDGEYIVEKSATQTKRREEKAKRVQAAEDYKKTVQELDELERTPAMIGELRKKMQNLSYITSEEKEIIISIISAMGIPVIIATGEGEKLCAMLNIEGKVDACYSRDTDMVALGAPLVINESAGYIYNPATQQTEEGFKCTLFKPILAALNMTYPTFLDLCIMSGCDFNDNIYRCGVATSYKLLSECNSIENLPAKYNDKKSCLNHVRCREIFAEVKSSLIARDPIVLDIDKDLSEARDRLEVYGAQDWLTDIAPLYKTLPTPSRDFIYRKPSLVRSRIRLSLPQNVIPPSQSSPKYINEKGVANLHKLQIERYKNRNGN